MCCVQSRLIETCEAAHHPYIVDPTNANLVFARNNVRRAIAEMQRHAEETKTPGPYDHFLPAISVVKELSVRLHEAGMTCCCSRLDNKLYKYANMYDEQAMRSFRTRCYIIG